jgi:P27 family predicted phage terminase small subunit
MGARGPKPKLAALERLEGNPSKRPVLDLGIEALGDVFVPEHLHEDAQACIEVIRGSMPPKVYAKVDSFLLSGFATAWAVHKRAAHEISNPAFGWLVTNGSGSLAKNPWVDILRGALKDMMSAGDRLGLDPKARAALRLPAEQPQSKFAGLIGRPTSSPSLNN